MGILYISYDGVLEPLGQSQVLSYLKKLTNNRSIHLISFEKSEDWDNVKLREGIKNDISQSGLVWHPLRYHKSPSSLATAWDITCGIFLGLWLVYRFRLQIVHARSYVPSVMALIIKRFTGVKFLFDMRGFWADERVEGALWVKNGYLYSIAKWLERHFLLSCDYIVTLTNEAVKEIKSFPYLQDRILKIDVITTCTDLEVFNLSDVKSKSKFNSKNFILGYVGSVGVSYKFEETLICFTYLKQIIPNSCLHILNRGDHKYILERLNSYKIDSSSFKLEEMEHSKIGNAMCEMNAAIFFINQSYSKKASAPTKLGEFLACGVPCLGNSEVGDMVSILEGENVGIILRNFDEFSMRESIFKLIELAREPDIAQRCRKNAMKYFSLENGVNQYEKIYLTLTEKNDQ
jgi:glycosyltransferase involved in cell wall biosynthesis